MFLNTSYYIIRGILFITFLLTSSHEFIEFFDTENHVSGTRTHILWLQMLAILYVFSYLAYISGTIYTIALSGCSKYIKSLFTTHETTKVLLLEIEGAMAITISLIHMLILGMEALVTHGDGTERPIIILLLTGHTITFTFHTVLYFMVDASAIYKSIQKQVTEHLKSIENGEFERKQDPEGGIPSQSSKVDNIEEYVNKLLKKTKHIK
jgi:hypothetical protein